MKLLISIVVGICFSLATTTVLAGGGPENVFLLVNSKSEGSKTIANHYINWRQIPPRNVMYLDWAGGLTFASGIDFREKILMPALLAIDSRGLSSQIDYIIYSSDFPCCIDLHPLFPGQTFSPQKDPSASISGVTYLAPLLLSQNPAILEATINWYVPRSDDPNISQCEKLADVPSRGFRWRYFWDINGKKTSGNAPGQRYLLSTMLGVTVGGGNTVDEVLSYLRRAAQADGSRPRGTTYFMWNKDVRSTARDKCFPSVAAQINAAGGHAVVQQGVLPVNAIDVAGLMTGAPNFNIDAAGVQILPGAICDHLTSAGAIFGPEHGQTMLSEFLRHGAAGASGTIVEPFAIQAKFPLASVQLHYVRGCSLAESFYQSVSAPFQLLIVGDPLCQPWAAFPTIRVAGVKPGEKVKGTLSITPVGPKSVGNFELFVDGRLAANFPTGAPLQLDTTHLVDGFHELRVVGSRLDPIETQGRRIVPIVVNNHDATVELKLSPAERVGRLAKLKLSVRQPGATVITVRQNSTVVGHVQAESGEIEVAASSLGRGPTTLQAFSEGKAPAASIPVRIFVE